MTNATVRIFEYADKTVIHVVGADNTLWQVFTGLSRADAEQQVQDYSNTYQLPIDWPKPAAPFQADKMPANEDEVQAILAPLIQLSQDQFARYAQEGLSISVEENIWAAHIAQALLRAGVHGGYLLPVNSIVALLSITEIIKGAFAVLNLRRAQLEDRAGF